MAKATHFIKIPLLLTFAAAALAGCAMTSGSGNYLPPQTLTDAQYKQMAVNASKRLQSFLLPAKTQLAMPANCQDQTQNQGQETQKSFCQILAKQLRSDGYAIFSAQAQGALVQSDTAAKPLTYSLANVGNGTKDIWLNIGIGKSALSTSFNHKDGQLAQVGPWVWRSA